MFDVSAATRPHFEVDSAIRQRGLERVNKHCKTAPLRAGFVDVRMPPGWDGIETTAKIWGPI